MAIIPASPIKLFSTTKCVRLEYFRFWQIRNIASASRELLSRFNCVTLEDIINDPERNLAAWGPIGSFAIVKTTFRLN